MLLIWLRDSEQLTKGKDMSRNQRLETLASVIGYWPGDNGDIKAGNAIEKMLLLGQAYGAGGMPALRNCIAIANVPEHARKAIIQTLTGIIL